MMKSGGGKFNWNLIFGLIISISFLIGLSVAERLPIVNTDNDTWGTTLNAFLLVSHEVNGTFNGTVSTSNINDWNVTAAKIQFSVVNSSHILDATIGAADIAFLSINNSHVASSAINTSQIVDFTIGAVNIAFLSINNSHVASSAINTSQIVDFTIGAVNIAFLSINNSHVASDAINTSQLDISVFNNTIDSNADNNQTTGYGLRMSNLSATDWKYNSIRGAFPIIVSGTISTTCAIVCKSHNLGCFQPVYMNGTSYEAANCDATLVDTTSAGLLCMCDNTG